MIADLENLARHLKTLGDPNRLGITMAISREPLSVTGIVNVTGLSQTLVSFHLRTLREAGIVRTRREGAFIYYRLANSALMAALDSLAETIASDGDEALQQEQTGNDLLTPVRRGR